MKKFLFLFLSLPFLMGAGSSYPETPEQVVVTYLQAIKDSDFSSAYILLTENMTRGLDSFSWVVEQKTIFEKAGVVINGYQVYDATLKDNIALVPNILSSKDNFINKSGADEYELYQLVNNNGYWEIDRQKLIDEKDRSKWFKKEFKESN